MIIIEPLVILQLLVIRNRERIGELRNLLRELLQLCVLRCVLLHIRGEVRKLLWVCSDLCDSRGDLHCSIDEVNHTSKVRLGEATSGASRSADAKTSTES